MSHTCELSANPGQLLSLSGAYLAHPVPDTQPHWMSQSLPGLLCRHLENVLPFFFFFLTHMAGDEYNGKGKSVWGQTTLWRQKSWLCTWPWSQRQDSHSLHIPDPKSSEEQPPQLSSPPVLGSSMAKFSFLKKCVYILRGSSVTLYTLPHFLSTPCLLWWAEQREGSSFLFPARGNTFAKKMSPNSKFLLPGTLKSKLSWGGFVCLVDQSNVCVSISARNIKEF